MTFLICVVALEAEQEIQMFDTLKTDVHLIIHKTSSYLRENRVCAHWTNQSTVHKEITAVYCVNHTKHTNT